MCYMVHKAYPCVIIIVIAVYASDIRAAVKQVLTCGMISKTCYISAARNGHMTVFVLNIFHKQKNLLVNFVFFTLSYEHRNNIKRSIHNYILAAVKHFA